jgi:hypothetical protein
MPLTKTENVVLRKTGEIAEAAEIATANGLKITYVIRLALRHGLQAAREKIEALNPPPARKGR